MAWTARSFETIREDFLAQMTALYTAEGRRLLTVRGSDAWMWASAFALVFLGTEYLAQITTEQVLPDRAVSEYLDRHGATDGLPRRTASPSSLLVALTGVALATADATQFAMVDAAGLRYVFEDTTLTLDGSGEGSATVVCEEDGTDGNLAVGAILTFVTAPADFDVTGTVAGTVALGEDTEEDADYAARIIAYRQRRPASGSREDWRTWAEEVGGVDVSYVYPEVDYTLSETGVPGAVTLVILGPAQGDSVDRTRIVDASLASRVGDYIEGTVDADGVAVPTAEQVQKRPVTLGGYTVLPATATETDVTIEVDPESGYPFCYTDFSGGYTVASATSTSAFTITPAPDTRVAAERPRAGYMIAVEYDATGATGVRGQYALTTIVTINEATGAVTCDPALPYTPIVGRAVLPAGSWWSTIRDSVFALFDALGPGDTTSGAYTPLAQSRWPTEGVLGRATLYVQRILAAALDATGVVEANVSAPAANVTPAPFALLMLRRLKVTAL